ncbi:MAG: GlsB/YeaQ/YmgE family stress response membrane protein [Candidatus Binataceae bacterium]
MGILSWLVVGLIAGFIGSKIVNRGGEGLVRDIILGVIGAIIGDAIFTELGLVGVTGVNLTSIVIAALGAIIVIVVYHAVIGRRVPA